VTATFGAKGFKSVGTKGSVRVAAFNKAVGLADGARVIRRQAQQDGYLFCPGLAPLATVNALRSLAVDVATDLGWIDRRARRTGVISVAGIRLGAYDDPRWVEFLRVVLRHHLFGALREEPHIVAVLEAIFGGACEPDAGDLCRVVSGDDPVHTTVAHQDHFTTRERFALVDLGATWGLPAVARPPGDSPPFASPGASPSPRRLGFAESSQPPERDRLGGAGFEGRGRPLLPLADGPPRAAEPVRTRAEIFRNLPLPACLRPMSLPAAHVQ
jgi:hypothetical protein